MTATDKHRQTIAEYMRKVGLTGEITYRDCYYRWKPYKFRTNICGDLDLFIGSSIKAAKAYLRFNARWARERCNELNAFARRMGFSGYVYFDHARRQFLYGYADTDCTTTIGENADDALAALRYWKFQYRQYVLRVKDMPGVSCRAQEDWLDRFVGESCGWWSGNGCHGYASERGSRV